MGGPEMAPQPPKRSERPREPVALSYDSSLGDDDEVRVATPEVRSHGGRCEQVRAEHGGLRDHAKDGRGEERRRRLRSTIASSREATPPSAAKISTWIHVNMPTISSETDSVSGVASAARRKMAVPSTVGV